MKMKWILIIIPVVIFILIPGCNRLENVTNSGSKLICQLITGNDLAENEGSTTIFIDVLRDNSVINDNGVAELTTVVLDPDKTLGTFYQDIMVEQIDVEYSRSDMPEAREGVDIPFSFSQRVNARVEVGALVELPFILVQHNAKRESPLVELINHGQEKILKLEAKCTFHGKDIAGNQVEPAVGTVSIWCGDFVDPE